MEMEEDISEDLMKLDKELRFCIVCNKQLPVKNIKFCSSKKCKSIYAKNKKENEKESFPQYICQHCGFINQLTFHPRFQAGEILFRHFVCSNCKKLK